MADACDEIRKSLGVTLFTKLNTYIIEKTVNYGRELVERKTFAVEVVT